MRRNRRYGRAPILPGSLALEHILAALSCETRLEILRCLAQREMGVTSIANQLELAINTVSQNLRVLWDSTLVEIECCGAARIYRLAEHLCIKITEEGVTIQIPCRDGAAITIRSRWDVYSKPDAKTTNPSPIPDADDVRVA